MKNLGWIVGVIAAVILCAWLTWRNGQNRERDHQDLESDKSSIVATRTLDRAQAEALNDRCLALLENGWETDRKQLMLQEADAGFVKLADEFPNDPLGLQNLCVTLLGRLKQTDRTVQPELFTELSLRLKTTIEKLRTLIPDDPIADIFAARLQLLSNDTAAAIASYRQGGTKLLAGPDLYFQLYSQLSTQETPAASEEAGTALKRALELSPGNLALAVEWLKYLAKTQNSELATYVETFRALAQPLIARNDSKIPKLLDSAKQAAADGQWSKVVLQTNFLRNVILPEIAFQHALQMLEPHALEFVRLEFQPQTLDALPKAPLQQVPEMHMVERALPQTAISDVTAIASEDFDLNGQFDLWALSGKRLRIFSFSAPDNRDGTAREDVPSTAEFPVGLEQLCDTELAIGAHGIRLADFDHDFQHRKDSLPASALPSTTPPATEEEVQQSNPNLTREQLIEKYLDTDLDMVVYGEEGVRFYRNDLDAAEGKRSWTEMPQASPLSELRGVRSVAVIDFDHDSDLDVAISSAQGISLWSNRGDWTFADFSSYSQLPPSTNKITDIVALDVDRNILNDFLLANPDGNDSLVLKSNLHGRFFQQADSWTENGFGGLTSLAVADVNADACWDVAGCGDQGTQVTLMKAVGHHNWQPSSQMKLSDTPARNLLVDDFDNDGSEDIVAWGEQGIEFFRRDDRGSLAKDVQVIASVQGTRQIATLDADQDGDLDWISVDDLGALHFWENVGGNVNHQLELVIRADEDGKQRPRERCNMHGVGSLVELKSGDIYQSRIVRGTRTRLGLGKQNSADVLRIVWTNGIPNNVLDISDRATVYDQQNLGGSCPYLYTWNGEKFEFCTDCLWASPIGLQIAQGQAAPGREWEFLRIDSTQLKPLDGQYVLQMTEELWEAAYFDSIQLLAVDHPREIEVFTNEKVGPADLAEFQVHVVRERKTPRRVVDAQGNDLAQVVALRDGRFSKTWQTGVNQGVTNEHYLEIDLGKVEHRDNVRLFLTGWMFPTCTSINVSMAENPLKPKSQAPSIWMPDADGTWIEVIPYAGFPGGKTKTIAIDLSNKFPSDDYRLRIVSNMELCWDEIFFSDEAHRFDQSQTVQAANKQLSGSTLHGDNLDQLLKRLSDSAPYRISLQPLVSADLHYRGFSQLVPQAHNAPKRYEYDRVKRDSIWPPMQGTFTRFGDVTSLLTQPDDLQAVLGAGDELTLRFQVTASQLADGSPLPEGWIRDFVLYNVGWDKDADLNTILGQSVEPLPFRGMKQYPYAPEQTFPDEPAHRQFLNDYQTRRQPSVEFWHQVREFSKQ